MSIEPTEIELLLEKQFNLAYQNTAVKVLELLNDEQRANVFKLFCTHCGSTDTSCQCWNDE